MEYILALLIVPVLWIIASKFIFKYKISVKEMVIQFGITVGFVLIAYYLAKANLTSDTEILNGRVTGKASVHVSCSHSYECHCYTYYTGTGKDRTSHRHCDTCYEHSYDVNWNVYTDIGDFNISRIDRRGLGEPPRWTKVYVGEPVSLPHDFTNYIKGAKFSLFSFGEKTLDEKFKNMVPGYPQIYDYYRVNRVLSIGVPLKDLTAMNSQLSDRLKYIGPSKQANITVVVVKTGDQNYRYVLEKAWLGGKKNDIVVVIGVENYPNISWVDTITLGKNAGNELLQVKMRDNLMALQNINDGVTIINKIADTVVSDFHRKSMKDFEYLEKEIQPSDTAMIVIFILTLLANMGLTYFFYREDI